MTVFKQNYFGFGHQGYKPRGKLKGILIIKVRRQKKIKKQKFSKILLQNWLKKSFAQLFILAENIFLKLGMNYYRLNRHFC